MQSSLVSPDKNNFAPRVGFAWQPRSDNRARSAGRLWHLLRSGKFPAAQQSNPGFSLLHTGTSVLDPISTPFVQVPQPNQFPLLFNNPRCFPSGGLPRSCREREHSFPGRVEEVPANGIYPDLHDFRTPYIQQYSLGIENEFANNWMLKLSYVGSAGRKLYRLVDLNQAVARTGVRACWVY